MITLKRFTLHTKLSELEVAKKIASLRRRRKTSKLDKRLFYYDGSKYSGTVSNSTFSLRRNLRYSRKENALIIEGKTKAISSGTEISLQIGVRVHVLVFILIWVLGVGTISGITLYYSAKLSSEFIGEMTLFTLIGIIVFAVSRAFYKREMKRSVNDLIDEFDATLISST